MRRDGTGGWEKRSTDSKSPYQKNLMKNYTNALSNLRRAHSSAQKLTSEFILSLSSSASMYERRKKNSIPQSFYLAKTFTHSQKLLESIEATVFASPLRTTSRRPAHVSRGCHYPRRDPSGSSQVCRWLPNVAGVGFDMACHQTAARVYQ